jgi:hypothetical protein
MAKDPDWGMPSITTAPGFSVVASPRMGIGATFYAPPPRVATPLRWKNMDADIPRSDFPPVGEDWRIDRMGGVPFIPGKPRPAVLSKGRPQGKMR